MRLGNLDALEHEFMTKRRYLDKDQVLDAAYIINKAPTIDAIPVVRCRECKHHNKAPCPMRLSLNWTEDKDFCSYGERKGGDA